MRALLIRRRFAYRLSTAVLRPAIGYAAVDFAFAAGRIFTDLFAARVVAAFSNIQNCWLPSQVMTTSP